MTGAVKRFVIRERSYRYRRKSTGFRAILIGVVIFLIAAFAAIAWFSRVVAYQEPDWQSFSPEFTTKVGEDGVSRLVLGASALIRTDGFTVAELAGTSQQMAFALGRFFAPEIARFAGVCDAMLHGEYDNSRRSRWGLTSLSRNWSLRHVDTMEERWQKEVAGLRQGVVLSGVDVRFTPLLRAQTVLETGRAHLQSSGIEFDIITSGVVFVDPGDGVSTGSFKEVDRPLQIGLSLSLPGFPVHGQPLPMVARVQGKGKIPYIAAMFPGFVGVPAGVNAHGVGVVVLSGFSFGEPQEQVQGESAYFLAKRVLETATTTKQAMAIVTKAKLSGAARIFITDAMGNTVRVDGTPRKKHTTKLDKPSVFNAVLDREKFAREALNERLYRNSPADQRQTNCKKLFRRHRKKSATNSVWQALWSSEDAQGDILPLGHRGACFDPQASLEVLLLPQTQEITMADYGRPGTIKTFSIGSTEASTDRAAQEVRRSGLVRSSRRMEDWLLARAVRGFLDKARAARWREKSSRVGSNATGKDRKQSLDYVARAISLVPSMPEALFWSVVYRSSESAASKSAASGGQHRSLSPVTPVSVAAEKKKYLDNFPDNPRAVAQIREGAAVTVPRLFTE